MAAEMLGDEPRHHGRLEESPRAHLGGGEQVLHERAQVVAQPVALGTTESATLPLVVRVPPSGVLARTIPIHVLVTSPAGRVALDATFKTAAESANADVN